ncbi:MAG: hypothetical protein AB4290_00190 [Spirulina sp.]
MNVVHSATVVHRFPKPVKRIQQKTLPGTAIAIAFEGRSRSSLPRDTDLRVNRSRSCQDSIEFTAEGGDRSPPSLKK